MSTLPTELRREMSRHRYIPICRKCGRLFRDGEHFIHIEKKWGLFVLDEPEVMISGEDWMHDPEWGECEEE